MADQPNAAADLQQRYRQFLDLLPLTLALAGLPTSEGRLYSEEQMEGRAITSGNSATLTVANAAYVSITTGGFPSPTLSETGALPSGVTFSDHGDGTAGLSGTPDAGTSEEI